MTRLKDLSGFRLGQLTVVDRDERRAAHGTWWNCMCDCGASTSVRSDHLRSGRIVSCGCYRSTRSVHGHASGGVPSPTYQSWRAMRMRCTQPSYREFSYYGGRGVTVCRSWSEFSNFLADMGERPEGRTLDRINVNGNYEPGNCRWATPEEQSANRRGRSTKADARVSVRGVL